MKKYLCLLLCMLFVCSVCYAETLTMEEMREMQAEAADALADINSVIAQRIHEEECTVSGDSLGKIKDLFPDETIACYIRDQLKKFSIEQTVTQEELDQIIAFAPSDDYPDVYDLTGIGLLRNLKTISFYTYNGWCAQYRGTELPEELFTLTKLETLRIAWINSIPLEKIPDSIGNLTNLRILHLENTQITSLPDSICNLTKLEELLLNDTDLTELPENIGNLTRLKRLLLSNTALTSLPESIWVLELEQLDMSGTKVK